jgi:hypothetical protein
MMGPRKAGYGFDRGALLPVGLLAAGLGLPRGCSVFHALAANDLAPQEDEPAPPSGWRGLPVDELSQTGC